MDATERNMLANELFEDEDVVEVKRSKAAPARNTTSAPQQAVKAKKKNRKRNTKNKGKRRTSN